MRYAFFGTPEFAAIILEKLIGAGLAPTFVVCNPDRPVGRKRVVTPPPVKQSILEQSEDTREQITLLQPEHPLEIHAALQNAACDLFVVAAYARILPREIFALPRLGAVGVHPSLLPRLRGSTPIQTAILEGDAEVGTTLFMLDEQIDHGPILAQAALPDYAPDTTGYETLMRELAALSAELLIETTPRFAEGAITLRPQDETLATFTKKFATTDGFVDLEKDSPTLILRKVLALNPEPGVWTYANALANMHMRMGGRDDDANALANRHMRMGGRDDDANALANRHMRMGDSAKAPTNGDARMGENRRIKILEVEIRDGKLLLKQVQYEGKKPQTLF